MTEAATVEYTEEELKQFDRETWRSSSQNQITQIEGRMAVSVLARKHGKDKCDAMFAEIKRREAASKKRNRR